MEKCKYYHEEEVFVVPPYPYMKQKKIVGMCGINANKTKCTYSKDYTKCSHYLGEKENTKEE